MKEASRRPGPLTRSDLFLPSSDWGSLVVGRASYTIDVDSKIQHARHNSEARLLQELKYASHLGLPAVMVTLHGRNHFNLARIVSNYIVKGASFQMWVQVPVCQPDLSKYEDRERPVEQTWDWWNTFRLVADSSSKINLCLDLTEELPGNIEIERWLGEPVKTVSFCLLHFAFISMMICTLQLSIPTSLFLINKKGYPVLSKHHQNFVRRFINLDIQVSTTLQVYHDFIINICRS